MEADIEQTCCSNSFPTIGNRCLTMECGLLLILGMLGSFYLGLLYLSIFVEFDVFRNRSPGPAFASQAQQKLFLFDHIGYLLIKKGIMYAHLCYREFSLCKLSMSQNNETNSMPRRRPPVGSGPPIRFVFDIQI